MQQVADPNPEVAMRVARGRERRRRTMILRGLVPLILIGVLLCAGAVRMRNRGHVAEARAQLQADIEGLVRVFEDTGTLPLFYPPRNPDGSAGDSSRFGYIDSTMVQHLRESSEPLIVAYSLNVRQILGSDVRVVAVREGHRIRVETLPAADFKGRLEQQERRAAEAVQAARQRAVDLP